MSSGFFQRLQTFPTQLRGFCVVLIVLVICTARHPWPWRVTVAAGAALALTPWLLHRRLTWWFLAASIGAAIALSPLSAANHHYLLLYMTLAIALTYSADHEHWREDLAEASRWLMVGVMGVAAFQKLLSPAYLDGSFFAHLLLDGGLGELFWRRSGSASRLVFEYTELFSAFSDPIDPRRATDMRLPARHMFMGMLAKVLAWAVILAEVALAALFAASKRSRRALLAAHACLLSFGVGLLLSRPEYVFLTTLLWLGSASGIASDLPSRIRHAYVVLGGIAALTAIVHALLS